jgi:hypothetical protein
MKLWELCRAYLTVFPEEPHRTLAKRISTDHSTYKLEQVRRALREIRGRMGKHNRERHQNKEFHLPPEKRLYDPYNIPDTDATNKEDYKLNIRKGNWLWLFDGHFPFHDPDAINVALEYGDKRGLNGIGLGGDWLDFAQISKFCADPEARSPSEEIAILREFLVSLRKSFKRIPIIYEEGNHEQRWKIWWWTHGKLLGNAESKKLEGELKLDELNIKWLPTERVVVYKELAIMHGHQLLKGASTPISPARTAYLKTNEITALGHLHKSSEYTFTTRRDKLVTCWSAGCLCNLHPDYAPVNQWNLGFQLLTVEDDKVWRIENKRIYKNKVF